MTTMPTTKYAKSADVHIAYQVVGEGAQNLVLVPGWVSHIEYAWEDPSCSHFLRRLASFSRLILLEELSGPWPSNANELVKLRRQRRAEYQELELPPDWTGMPEPILLEELDEGQPDVISGIGA